MCDFEFMIFSVVEQVMVIHQVQTTIFQDIDCLHRTVGLDTGFDRSTNEVLLDYNPACKLKNNAGRNESTCI